MDESRPIPVGTQGVSTEKPRGGLEKPDASTFTTGEGERENSDDDDGRVSELSDEALIADWTSEEEKALVRKLDSIVMPLVILGLTALQYDRVNIGNALTDDFLADVGITQNQYNVGQQLLSVGIVLLEIPSNLILYWLGPPIWISCQMFVWGLVATLQAFQKGYGAFLATRLILGLCESGFIPAGLFSITQWYKREETSKRFAWFFIGNQIASATAGLLAYGIFQMQGISNLAGWQWMFILEGLFTITCSLIFAALHPGVPRNPISLLKLSYFTERERSILSKRVIIDDPSKAHKKRNITKAQLMSALSNWRIYPHLLLTLCAMSAQTTYASYAPTLIASWGYGKLRSNALVSVGYWVLLVTNLIYGWIADKTGKRGPVVLAGLFLSWGFSLGMLILHDSNEKRIHYVILTLTLGFANPWHAVNGSWLAINARSPGERSITMAMFIMSANAAGIAGSQFFQSQDKKSGYKNGWTIIISLNATAIVICAGALAQYIWSNRRIREKGLGGAVEVTEVGGVDEVGAEGKGEENGDMNRARARARVVERGYYL